MTRSQSRPASREELLPMLPLVTCSAMVDAMSQRHAHPAHVLDLVSPTECANYLRNSGYASA